MIKFAKYVLALGALIAFMKTQLFSSFLVGAASMMSSFNTALYGQLGPEVIFFLLCSVIVIIIAIYSVWM